MFIKVFTIEFSRIEGSFSDSEVTNFLQGKELITVKDYLLEVVGKNFLVLIITYTVKEDFSKIGSNEASTSANLMGLLSDENKNLFDSLKSWRLHESKKQAIPPFIVFTNKQLAEIASLNPTTLNHLSQIDGIGPIKLEKYGDIILKIVDGFIKKDEVAENKF